jgi:hypothetical protein
MKEVSTKVNAQMKNQVKNKIIYSKKQHLLLYVFLNFYQCIKLKD